MSPLCCAWGQRLECCPQAIDGSTDHVGFHEQEDAVLAVEAGEQVGEGQSHQVLEQLGEH